MLEVCTLLPRCMLVNVLGGFLIFKKMVKVTL